MEDFAAPLSVLFTWLDEADGPRYWQDLDLDALPWTPPRSRGPLRWDGQPWRDSLSLQVATDAELKRWESLHESTD